MKTQEWAQHLAARRWRRCVVRAADTTPVSHAQGVALLLARQNEALRCGNGDALVKASGRLEQFLEAAQVAAERTAQARASCLDRAPAPETAPPADGSEARTLAEAPARGGHTHRYSISSVTLAEAYAYLTQHLPGARQEPEFMLAVSGTRADSVLTLERLIEVRMAHQSFGQASFDMQDFARVAEVLYQHGLALHGVFHSHRFGGLPAPSGTDMRLQGQLEEGGYPSIQAVFSETGHVCFFAKKRPFSVEIHGTGVEPVDGHPNAFHILQYRTLPHPTIAAASRR